MLRPQFLGEEPCIDNVAGLREEMNRTEVADKTMEEIAARKVAKKAARKAELKAEKEALMQAEKKKSRKGDDDTTNNSEGQAKMTCNSGHLPQVQQLEDKDNPQQKKKKGRKRKSDRELPVRSEVPSKDHHKHKKRRVDSDAQDANFRKINRKKRGPEHSPFFQRSGDPKAKKDSGKKAEKQMGFRTPMIR